MDFIEKLIEEVKKYPVLYKKSCGGYKNSANKVRIWTKIAKKLSSTDEICQCKWKGLRDRFGRELKKLKSGSSDQTSEWEYYSSLEFLVDHVRSRISVQNQMESSSNHEFLIPSDNDETINDEDPVDFVNSIVMNKTVVKEKLCSTLDFLNNYLKKKTVEVPIGNKTNHFGETVSNIIEYLSPRNQIVARAYILKYLAEMQLNELENNL